MQRYLLHADIHVGSRLRLWTELNSSFENGRVGSPQPVIDVDKLDLHQGFVEFEIIQRPGVAVRVRGGRQEIEVGSGRMYSLREGPNVPLSFDGVRAIAQTEARRLDAWVARPVTTTPRIFDSGGIGETQSSTKVSPMNCVIPLEPGSGEMDCGHTASRACINLVASVQATFAPGEVWSKHRADSLVDGLPASRLTSTLRVGTGTDRVRISEPLTPSFRVVSIRDAHNFSGRAIRFVSNRH